VLILRLAQIRELPKHLMLLFKLLQLILLHQRLSDGIKIAGTRLDLKNPSSVTMNILKAFNNSIVDHLMTFSHHTFQQTVLILRLAQIREFLQLHSPEHGHHQLTLLLQSHSAGLKIAGTRLDLKNPSSVTINILKASFNLMLKPLQLVKVLLEKDSLELLISKSLLQPTPVLTLTKPLPKIRIAPLMETPPGTLSPPLELPNQLMPWLNHTQDILNTESIKR
jgi:hypothetical protein